MVLALILGVVPALGETTTILSDYSDEMINTMLAMLQAEKIRRFGEPFTVYPGEYVIGLDIPAGIYRVDRVKGDSKFFVFFSAETAAANVPDLDYWIDNDKLGTSVIGKITLREGYILSLGATVTFSPYEGIQRTESAP